VTDYEKYLLLVEALRRIRAQASGHTADQEPGWGRWETTLRLCDEALIEAGAEKQCSTGYQVTFNGLKARCCHIEKHAGYCQFVAEAK